MAFKGLGDRQPEPQAATLIDLWAEIEEDESFAHLRTEGNRLVPGIGSYEPAVMIVGSAPGAMENTHGVPFCGASGTVVRDLMDTAGLWVAEQPPDDDDQGPSMNVGAAANTWLTYTLKYRPPGRAVTVGEMLRAQPYLRREWMILGRPRVMVALGATAWSALSPVTMGGVMSWAGQPMLLRDNKTWLYPMLHAEYGLQNADAQPKIERHWMQFGRWLDEEGIR